MKLFEILNLSDIGEKISYKYWIMLAAGASLLLGLMVFLYLGDNSDKTTSPAGTEMVQVIVATQDIAPRTTIQSGMLKTKSLPRDLVPEGAITKLEEVVGKPAYIQIMKDDIITSKKILSDPKMAGFIGMIPPDCRAVTISINDVTGVAGLARPGDYVDIMVVSGDQNSQRVTSNILLQNIMLLAINKSTVKETASSGQAQNGDTSKDSPSNSAHNNTALTTATLAVTPKDAMKLVTGAHSGTLYLVLRPYKPRNTFISAAEYSKINAKANQPPAPANTSQPAYSAPAAPPQAAPPATAAPARTYGGIEIIRGTTVTREGN